MNNTDEYIDSPNESDDSFELSSDGKISQTFDQQQNSLFKKSCHRNYHQTSSNRLHRRMKTWTPEEDESLINAITKYGSHNWSKIAEIVGNGRDRSQCLQRWSRGLNPKILKTKWSPEEDAKLLELVRKYGEKCWMKISIDIGTRCDSQCRYRYSKLYNEKQVETIKSVAPVKLPPISSFFQLIEIS
ncbi:r2r3-MYB transcription factor [Tritrichomonas foetus]|uniref:R2r3-MYB transcription factor n=1 Tax=Tritrichomonas foetus TaxID=1144522 RepID=A0A1J4JN23_9EUKA|nr:r2r3-MYB transcription factor [Tritrichomonas foetus]|eukprot:OHS99839.1 r2r3-MYB transcription factor [Tritrichomonas foetus]